MKILLIEFAVLAFALQWRCGAFHATGNVLADQFMHANVFHLALNCWATWTLVRSDVMPAWVLVLLGIAFGAIGFACTSNVIGLSGALYAVMGMQWRLFGTRTNAIVTAIVLALGIILPGLTFVGHAVPFALGLAFGWAYNLIKDFYNETTGKI